MYVGISFAVFADLVTFQIAIGGLCVGFVMGYFPQPLLLQGVPRVRGETILPFFYWQQQKITRKMDGVNECMKRGVKEWYIRPLQTYKGRKVYL